MRNYKEEFKDAAKQMQKRLEEDKQTHDEMEKEGRELANTYFYKKHPKIFDRLLDDIMSGMVTIKRLPVVRNYYLEINILDHTKREAFKEELKMLFNKELANISSGSEYSINVTIDSKDVGVHIISATLDVRK